MKRVSRMSFLMLSATTVAGISLAAPAAADDEVWITVMKTGNQGPVSGCPHTVALNPGKKVPGTLDVRADGKLITPVKTDKDGLPYVVWVPNHPGRHTIEAVQHDPNGRIIARGTRAADGMRTGFTVGNVCMSTGGPIPLDPETGTLNNP